MKRNEFRLDQLVEWRHRRYGLRRGKMVAIDIRENVTIEFLLNGVLEKVKLEYLVITE